jgi:murein DD-endopeptidase / murein LD-carboxypeptidase
LQSKKTLSIAFYALNGEGAAMSGRTLEEWKSEINWKKIAVHIDPFGFLSLTAKEGQIIADKANKWIGTPYEYGGNSRNGIDCSHFVYTVYEQAGYRYPYTGSGGDWRNAGFVEVEAPQAGDVIKWEGHVGIVVDQRKETFIGAQSEGVAETSYKKGKYWGNIKHEYFRYNKKDSREKKEGK